MYQLELVWNREFDWVPFKTPDHCKNDLDACIKWAQRVENMGDGAAVKKTRIVDQDGKVVWAYGEKVE